MRFVLSVVLFAVLGAPACASTQLTSMTASEARGRTVDRILVLAEIGDLAMMQAAENALARSTESIVCDPICRSGDSVFVAAHTVLFPGRSYSADTLAAILRQYAIDAVLVLSPSASGMAESFVPPTLTTTCATWNSITTCNTRASGGAVIRKPWATYAARLIDVNNGATLWIATSRSSGSAFATFTTLLDSVALETVKRLRTDGFIR
ncbi:MAG: hypothetical protein JNL44_13450 [Gemmatimonadetes bacterium]|nr:hypothetical protein [Gemmatimonadota bacterium]